ncbi:sodium-translocating pyrophosphatase [Streptomyces oceani]|uniref:K(+)-insensitive pyrophosphate-energized proton pump n=1 Tax=Streptomyces oceani TaxID=1075402 RepID=A0A1E7JVZ6_9ACTN|nr:sodium-translocating pyrophosphatase [Streptomyces oceani]OEU95490.1 potassium transporter [Streptomyces oceani]
MAGQLSPLQLQQHHHLAEAALTSGNRGLVIVIAVVALAALGLGLVLVRQVLAADEGTESMKKIAAAVQEGANAYLARQLRTLGVFAVAVFFLLFLLPADDMTQRLGRSLFFLVGAAFSAATGYIGMWLAVRSNVRVAAAARAATVDAEREPAADLKTVAHAATKIAFRTGGVVGMLTVGLGLFGAAVVVLVYANDAPKVLEGFGLGAALIAMFMRVGGGIFTKAADVGADLVGKVEQGIPEDDPRNAATIADNVGDNVGDCAGMAADLFESYAVTLVAALILGTAVFGDAGLAFPLVVPAIGVITAMIGVFAVAPRSSDRSGMTAINRGFFISAVISLVLVAVAAFSYLPASYADLANVPAAIQSHDGNPQVLAVTAVAIGIVLAALIQQLTGYFTETTRKPVRDVGQTSLTGPATVVLSGFSLGLESAVYTALLIGLSVYGAFLLGGGTLMLALFAVALAGTGLLTTVGVIVAMDTFGPVSDNAQGIAEMSGDVDGQGAQVLTDLDAVGNTTKAITKGIAIATAVLAAAALFGSYRIELAKALGEAGEGAAEMLEVLDIAQPSTLVGLMLGASVVFLFSGLAINAVSRSAGAVVFEVRRQFREKPGIMDHTEKPEYGRVVDICTKDALRELTTPGLLAVFAPICVGFTFGVGALAAFLAGAIGAGTLMAVFLANSGGAWDNAKKMVEDGHHGGKGSEAHEATVIGDTVGDPFKDTAGPAINPLLKVMNLVALLIAPAVVQFSYGDDKSAGVRAAVAVISGAIIVGAVYVSKRRGIAVSEEGNTERVTQSGEPVAAS